jgi:hypothetical protein
MFGSSTPLDSILAAGIIIIVIIIIAARRLHDRVGRAASL